MPFSIQYEGACVNGIFSAMVRGMFASVFAFALTFGQIVLLGISYYAGWPQMFAVVFYELSPIMVFLALLEYAGFFTGETTEMLWVGLGFCGIKYFMLARAWKSEDPNVCNVAASVGEVLLVGAASWYVVTASY